MLQEAGYIDDTVALIFPHIQCLHLMYSEVTWVLQAGTKYLRKTLKVLSCSPTREGTRIYQFITKNQASFHLW